LVQKLEWKELNRLTYGRGRFYYLPCFQ